MIPNFYKLEEGAIYIDGQEINDVTLQSLRKNIGIVQQDVFLFNGTMKENILYGRLDATEEEINNISNKEFKRKYREKAFSWRGRKIIERNLNILKDKSSDQ